MKIAVVAYTRFSHTRTLAQELARALGAELREIREPKKHGYPTMGFGAVLNMHFRIEPMDLDFSSFDLVVLCTPIWAGRPACPTRTFLRDARLEGKRLVIVFSTWGGDVKMALEHIERELAGKRVQVEHLTSTVTKDVPEEALRAAGRDIARQLAARLGTPLEAGLPPEPTRPSTRPELGTEGPAPLG